MSKTKITLDKRKNSRVLWQAYGRIEKSVSMDVFSSEDIAQKMEQLFKPLEELFLKRYKEIYKFLKLKGFDVLGPERIFYNFRGFFYEQILNEATGLTVNGNNDYNLKLNIYSCITEERIKRAIAGKPMIDAFVKSINRIPKNKLSNRKEIIESLEKQFPIYTKSNYCGGCGCSCSCDEGCNGDYTKCTSEKALSKNCSHCCSCYLSAMLKNMNFKDSV